MEIGMENISEKPDTLAIPVEELKDEGQFTITRPVVTQFLYDNRI